MNKQLVNKFAKKLKKVLLHNVHPKKGATINLLDSFLRTALDGGSNDYYGTFPANMIPRHLLQVKRFQIIINTSRTDDPPELGGHFIVVEATPEHVVYIDPFGQPCMQPDIIEFIKNCKRPETYFNNVAIQHPTSVFCPLYCALFILYYHLKPRWNLNFSSTNLKSNEEKCITQLNRLISDPRLTPKSY